MKRFKYNNAIHKIALSAIVASLAGVVACDDVYWDREAYDGFIDTFGVKHPSQFDLNNNVCAYIARESMGIEKLNDSNWQDAIADYHTKHPNDPIAPECLVQIDSNIAASAPDENGDSTDTQPSNSSENLALYKDPDFLKCLRAQIKIIQSRCDAVSVSKTGDENEGRMYIQVAEDITSKEQLDATIFACAQNDKNKDKNVCSDTATTQEHRNILNYRQCPNGYSLVVDGDKANRTYVCARTVCKSVAVHFETDMLNCGVCGNACDPTENCSAGTCVPAECPEGQIRCDGKCIDPLTDPKYCGANSTCDVFQRCSEDEVNKMCVEGACASSCPSYQPDICGSYCLNFEIANVENCNNDKINCKANYADVDKDENNGCEVNLLNDSNHCGQIDRKCTDGNVCIGGDCMANPCDDNKLTACLVGSMNQCIDINSTNADHCGACNYKCSSHGVPNAKSETCENGNCLYKCDANYRNVGSDKTLDTADKIKCVNPLIEYNFCGKLDGALKNCAEIPGTVCIDGECKINCPTDQVVCDGKCVDPMTDPNYCGANSTCDQFDVCATKETDKLCVTGQCSSSCSNAQPNICGSVCLNFNDVNVKSCDKGKIECKEGFADVDKQVNTGCEVNLKTDNNHCGKEKNVCTNGRTCQNGVCSCPSGYQYCDNKCIDPMSDPNYCGTGQECSKLNNCTASAVNKLCVKGACSSSCPSGQAICGDFCVDYEQLKIAKCDRRITLCMQGFADVDGKIENGCEVDLSTNNDNCKTVGNKCVYPQTCQKGVCSCPANQPNVCGSVCLNFNDVHVAACESGKVKKCIDGYEDVDKNPNNGCEVNLKTDNNHCGRENNQCTNGRSCQNGVCLCPTGYAYCDNKCVDPNTNPNYCGITTTCGELRNCTNSDVNKLCVQGSCSSSCPKGQTICGAVCLDLDAIHVKRCTNAVIECKDNFDNLDGIISNGCEVDLLNDSNHCGKNKVKCTNGRTCQGGTCACPEKLVYCGNKCVDPETDPYYCGANANCSNGKDCTKNAVNKICSGSVCISSCPSTQPDSCGNACFNFAELNIASCNNGKIVCKNGFENYDGIDSNGCEVDLNSSNSHCGAKDNKCTNGRSCQGGKCKCSTGFVYCGGKCIDPNTDPTYCGAKASDTNECYDFNKCENSFCANGTCKISHCTELTKLPCGDNGECVDVVETEAHCGSCDISCEGTTPACVNRQCVECKKDENCLKTDSTTTTPFCNTATNKCVECLNSDHCANNENGFKFCNNSVCRQCIKYTDCVKPEGGLAMACDEGACVITACHPDYYLSADKASCIKNQTTACGSEKNNCETKLSEIVTGVACIGGECKVSKCKEDYDVNGDQTECVKKETGGTDPGNGGEGSGAEGGTGGSGTGDNGGTESP